MSEVTAEQLKHAHALHPVTALEIEYSLATRFIEKEILPTAREIGCAVVPNLDFGKGDYRASLPRFQPENLQHNLTLVTQPKDFALQKGFRASQVALAWLLAQGDDIFPIVA